MRPRPDLRKPAQDHELQLPYLMHCRIGLYMKSRRLRCAAPRGAPAARLCVEDAARHERAASPDSFPRISNAHVTAAPAAVCGRLPRLAFIQRDHHVTGNHPQPSSGPVLPCPA